MLAYIQGTVVEKSPTRVVLDVNGLGYELHIPVSTYEKIPARGQQARLFTYLHVREDLLQIYGFWQAEERDLFLQLISVSGVGPRMAQGILSKVSVADFTRAVSGDDYSMLTQIPGVGRKTAQRLVMELKDKLMPGKDTLAARPGIPGAIAEEAVLALVSLGYRKNEAEKMVRKALQTEEKAPPLEVLIKKALQVTL